MDDKQTAVDVNIDDIIYVGKWKYARSILEGIIRKRVNRKQYRGNKRIVIYKDSGGRVGTMATIDGIKTVKGLQDYLLSFDGLAVESE